VPATETRAGDIVIADIGIPGEVLDGLDGPYLDLLTRAAMRELVTPRQPDSHKGDYGRVLIVAGSIGKTGAAHLCATGALRSGAGLVTIATPAGCQAILSAIGPEYMTEALHETVDDFIPTASITSSRWRDVLAIGPGSAPPAPRASSCSSSSIGRRCRW
jgi:NAD(P)H-hydrate epimerase